MLQQTQVQTVIPYYHRFLAKFPSFEALAAAPLDSVLKMWEGLGYYSRARNLHALAKRVVSDFNGRLPSDMETLLSLPGIGRYSAGAVLSIAFDQDVPLVDGNVKRVLARYYGIRKDISDPEVSRFFWTTAEKLLVRGQASAFNQGLMELGALICQPRNPDCPRCPVRDSCQARALGIQNEIPVKKKKLPVPHLQIGAGVIWRDDQLLISQRPLNGLLGGLWEFPGGKQELGESLPETVRREIKEELGIDVAVRDKMAEVDHAYSHFKITLHAYHCDYVSGQPQRLGVRDWKWIEPRELGDYAFPAANQPIILTLKKATAGESTHSDRAVPAKTKKVTVPKSNRSNPRR